MSESPNEGVEIGARTPVDDGTGDRPDEEVGAANGDRPRDETDAPKEHASSVAVAERKLGKPMLLRLRSGKTAALVIGPGIGGGITLLGVGSAALAHAPTMALLAALTGYLLATLPLFVGAAILVFCRTELWLDPEANAFTLLTFRPWRLRPRVEQASVSEYSGVRTDTAEEADGGGVLVSLVTVEGESVALRQFRDRVEAFAFGERVAAAAGLWWRHPTGNEEAAGSGVN
jgi:hypothetical protein